jgi:FixJ family two-component response regulator
VVSLDQEERERLESLVRKGRESARVIRRAHTLLMVADGRLNREIAPTLRVSEQTVIHTTKAYVGEGLDAALYDTPRVRTTNTSGTGRATCSSSPSRFRAGDTWR